VSTCSKPNVLRAHLGEGDEVNPNAWRAALRVFEHAYGRAPDQVEVEELPQTTDDISRLSTAQLAALLGRSPVPPLSAVDSAKPQAG
jgi:hypothetical protein